MAKQDGTHSDACFKAEAEIDRLRAENERLRTALRPFAECMNGYDGHYLRHDHDDCAIGVYMDYQTVHGLDTEGEALTLGDLRRAAAALKGDDDES